MTRLFQWFRDRRRRNLQAKYAQHRAAYREANPPISADDIESTLVALEIEKDNP